MKPLRVTCFILGVISVISFVLSFFFLNYPDKHKNGFMLVSFRLGITIVAVVISAVLAKKLNRSVVGWIFFSLFFPFISCFILPFLDEAPYRSSSFFGGSSYGGSYYADKKCSACGKSVPLSSTSGQRCPHCGVYWSSESKI